MKNRKINPKELKVGNIVMSHDQDDDTWDRAIITKIDKDKERVFFKNVNPASDWQYFEWDSPFNEIEDTQIFRNLLI